jgi:hypothetical protein
MEQDRVEADGWEDWRPPYITIHDIALARLGRQPNDPTPLTGEDFARVDLAILGGCGGCQATLAAYNAYPSLGGFWQCADCIADDGFETVEEFEAFERPYEVEALLAACERALEELLNWNAMMGGFDAPAWRLAREVRHQLARPRTL